MDINSEGRFDAVLLDHIARQVLGRSTSGISVGGNFSRIHLLNDSAANQRRASDILNHFDTLQLLADRTAMREGEADPVIRCRDGTIANDSDVGYLVLLDGEVYGRGNDSVVDGEMSLTLASPVAGAYSVFVYRLRGNYASASVQIVIQEA